MSRISLVPPEAASQKCSTSSIASSSSASICSGTGDGKMNCRVIETTILFNSLAASNKESTSSAASTTSGNGNHKSRIFPSTRFFIAVLLCLCFICLSISTSNISVSMVCMVRKPLSLTTFSPALRESGDLLMGRAKRSSTDEPALVEIDTRLLRILMDSKNDTSLLLHEGDADDNAQRRNNDDTTRRSLSECQLARIRKHAMSSESPEKRGAPISERSAFSSGSDGDGWRLAVLIESCQESELLAWSSTDQGIVFAAQNAGSLLMLITGTQADRLNSKWTIVVALVLLAASNIFVPIIAHMSIWLVVMARVLTGFSDALLQPSTSSMITRWFPPKERPFAIGLITGGRQIGTLLILPVAGFLCSRRDILKGWPAIFYLSALIASMILVIWLFMSADKPSKHFCTSLTERYYVEDKIAEESVGKRKERKAVPWRKIATCRPLYIGVAALICHEYPLVIMLQLLPKYISDVLEFSTVTNGIVSSLPIGVLFISKTLSSSLSSCIGARKKGRFIIARTPLVKIFNAIASLGLGICVGIVPLLTSRDHKAMAILALCMANAFAGLHTPGVQTALLQLAPAYTGVITGIAFGFVAIFSIINKLLSNFIVQSGSIAEWSIVFWIAAIIALLPVIFFTIWGSADRQPWATLKARKSGVQSVVTIDSKHRYKPFDCCKTHPILGTRYADANGGSGMPSKAAEAVNSEHAVDGLKNRRPHEEPYVPPFSLFLGAGEMGSLGEEDDGEMDSTEYTNNDDSHPKF